LPLRIAERLALLAIMDLVLTGSAVLAALWLWAWRDPVRPFSRAFVTSQGHWFPILPVLWLLLSYLNNLYDSGVADDFRASAAALFRVSVTVFAACSVLYFFAPHQSLPRGVVLYYTVFALVLVGLWRTAYIGLSRTAFRIPALVVGAGWAGRTVVRTIREGWGHQYELLGYVDDDPAKLGQRVEGLPVVGSSDDLTSLVRDNRISQVILAITHDVESDLLVRLLDCLELGAEIVPMPILYERLTGRVPVEHVGGNWYVALPIQHPGVGRLQPFAKRALDIVLASMGLVCLGLALPIIAVAIYLDSPGPIIYTQERVGKGGSRFRLYKFRSMVADAEHSDAVWAQENDPRVTRVGRLLRKTHVDEFPQFLNIIRGEMSTVGPRPERPEFAQELEKEIPFYRVRHAVKPGMAGWGLVRQGYAASRDDALVRLQYDLCYIKHQSLWLDLLILLRTVVDVLTLGGR